jgi:hypothetical protein
MLQHLRVLLRLDARPWCCWVVQVLLKVASLLVILY